MSLARIEVPDQTAPLERVDELAPSLRVAMKEMRRATLDETQLEFAEIEVVRLRCAQINGCETCFGYRMVRDDPARAARAQGRLTDEFYASIVGDAEPVGVLTPREILLREFCDRFYGDHFALSDDDEFWARLHEVFDDAELTEAGITVMSFGMSARFNHVFGVDAAACDIQVSGAAQES
jgi:alkylhydroperoxidase family enzyme